MQESINNPSMLKVGSILHGTYRIDSYLSSGGFGNTYIATNVEFDERVAIKEFFMKGVTQREDNQTTVSVSNSENTNSFLEQKEKFKKEARRIRQLKNEHIVAVHDLFEENGTAYYVMDFVDGENLSERLKRTGKPMTEKEVHDILPQILDALKSVHDAGIWHLDLKPANIMVDKAGNVKLIDFGASKQLNSQKGGATTSTAISYTNGYAPREQMEQNYDKFGPWTDIYALGATLYNLLTNKRPPLPTDIDDDVTVDKHESLPFPDSVSYNIKTLVLSMLRTNRLQRPQDIAAIIDAEQVRTKGTMQTPKEQIITPEDAHNDEETIIATPQSEEIVIGQKIKQKRELIQEPIPKTSQYDSDDSNDTSYLWKVIGIVAAVILLGYFLIPKGSADSFLESSTNEDYKRTENVQGNNQLTSEADKIYTGKIYDVVEEMPEYPGGPEALFKYLSENIKYPEEAEEKGIEGRVIITIIVEKDGSISEVEVVNHVNPLLDNEAVRVIKSMQRWIPGKQNGKTVRVKYTVPITFKLQ